MVIRLRQATIEYAPPQDNVCALPLYIRWYIFSLWWVSCSFYHAPSNFLTHKKTDFNEKMVRDTCRVLFKAVEYIHSKEIVHRDLKPQNILLASEHDSTSIRIVDFGLAFHLRDEHQFDRCGTARYMAPEVIKYKPQGKVRVSLPGEGYKVLRSRHFKPSYGVCRLCTRFKIWNRTCEVRCKSL